MQSTISYTSIARGSEQRHFAPKATFAGKTPANEQTSLPYLPENIRQEEERKLVSKAKKAKLERTVEKGLHNWFATPAFLRSRGTALRQLIASPAKTGLLYALIASPALSVFVYGKKMLKESPAIGAIAVAAPVASGAYGFVSQHMANQEMTYWLRELGPKALWGDVQHHHAMEREADRKIQLQSSREFGLARQAFVPPPGKLMDAASRVYLESQRRNHNS